MNQKVIAVLFAGFIAGVLLRSFVNFGLAGAGFFVFLGLIFIFVRRLMSNKGIFIALFFIAVALGMTRYEIKDARDFSLDKNVGSRILLQGIISDEPDERENYTRLILNTDKARILVTVNRYPEYKYGDEIKINGILKKPKNLSEDFNWQDYLSKDDIYYEMFYPGIELVAVNKGGWLKRQLFSLKEKYLNALGRVIPEPHSAFMAGLTVGAKQSIPKGLQEDFRKTGIIHVVVLSGYNITLVADTIMKIFSFLPRFLGIGLGVAGIILFTILTGASATAVRASIMALLVILARTTGRIYQITWALFLTGFFMILQNPKILRFDASFQLSFLATLALIYLAPYFEKKLRFIPKKWKLREISAATISTQIFVLPLLLYKMGIFSAVSLPVNLLILIFVPVTMFFGFITGILGMIAQILAVPFGWISYAFLQYELFVVKIFAKLPFASFNISNFPLWLMLGMYAVYAIIIYEINAKNKTAV